MKLFIDTSDNQKTVVGLDNKRWEKKTTVRKSQQLLSLIDKTLKKNQKTLKNITAIEVFLGPGSFTGLKVGVAVANSLGWALKVPINGKKIGQPVEPKYE